MNDVMSIAITAAVAVIAIALIAATYAYKARRDAYYKGRDDENKVTVEHFEALRGTIAALRGEANLHQQTIDELEYQNAEDLRDVMLNLQRARTDNTVLHGEITRLEDAMAILQAPPPASIISHGDINRIQEMAEKLRNASAAFHAIQQFKASKEADRLAFNGTTLAENLRLALNTRCHVQPQDAAA